MAIKMEKIGRIFSRHHVAVTFLLIALCLSIVTPTLIQFSTAADSANSIPKQLDDKSNYQPIEPPEPHTPDGPINRTTTVYDIATGTKTEVPYDPSTVPDELDIESTEPYAGLLSPDVTPATIFPPDDRTVVPYSTTTTYPWRTICKIYMKAADGTGWMGSAAMIGAGQGGHGYWILTAAHCVYMHDHGGWVSSIEVIPGYDGVQSEQYQKMPYYHAWVTVPVTYTAWVNSADWNYDIAWCKLDRNLGDYTGWMGRLTAGPGWGGYTGILNTAGYPGDKDGGVRMYFDSDYGTYANEYKIWFLMDLMGGQSGSPVWYYDGTSRYIVGNVAYHGSLPYGNSGTRLNQATFDWLNYYLALYPAPTDKADLLDDGQTWSGFSPTTVTAGVTSFHVWNDVRNFGTKASGGFYVDYYASTDTIISTSDYLIGWAYISNVNPFTYADSDLTKTFPSSIPPGTYWIGWIIDSLGNVPEFDETNNIAYKNSYKLTVVPPKYTITFYTDPTTIGSITFAGTTYIHGQTGQYAAGSYSVTANVPAGWTFSNWVTTGGVSVSGSTATVTGAGTIKAVFTQVKYTIIFYMDPSTIGSITFAGTTYTHGQTGQYAAGSYTVTANAPSGWTFSNWVTTGGVTISGSTATVTGTGTIKAVFTQITASFKIWTDKTTYKIGETMKVYVRVKNPGAALPVRALMYLKLPDGTLYGPLLDMTTTIPAGYDSGDVLWQTFTIPSAPLATYTWIAELRNPTTSALISQSTWQWQLLAATTTETPVTNVIIRAKLAKLE